MHPLVKFLEEKRGDTSKAEFAARLGLSYCGYWRLTKNDSKEGREPGEKVRRAVRSNLPDAPDSLFLPVAVDNCAITKGHD